jgi:hypothetical protein
MRRAAATAMTRTNAVGAGHASATAGQHPDHR